jgi:hypothetical protein
VTRTTEFRQAALKIARYANQLAGEIESLGRDFITRFVQEIVTAPALDPPHTVSFRLPRRPSNRSVALRRDTFDRCDFSSHGALVTGTKAVINLER